MGAGPDLVRLMFDCSDVGLAVLDTDLRIVDVNATFAAVSGVQHDGQRGRTLEEGIPRLASIIRPLAQTVLETGQGTLQHEVVDDNERWYVSHWPLVENAKVVGVGLRIHRAAGRGVEDALRRSEAQFRAICEGSPMGIFLTDTRGTSLYSNPANLAQMGLTLEESQGHGWQLAIHPDDREMVSTRFLEATKGGTPYRGINRYLRKDGSVVLVDVRASAIRDGDRVIGYVGIGEDITEQKRLEAQLLQAQKLDSIGRLAGGIAHDFNNLLTVILNQGIMAQRACDSNIPPREELALIHDAATQGTEVTRQLLAFARRQPFDPSPLDLNVLTEGITRFLVRLVGERIHIAVSLASDIGIVRGDRAQLEQVIVNLALNARDAMPDGGTLSIRTENVVHEGRPSVKIVIADTGRGISDADRAHVFEPFFSTKPSSEGTGLGLATCYGIVKQHGGSVSLASTVGKGTTFEIVFPRVDEVVTPIPRPDTTPPSSGRETILVVEDQAIVRATAVSTLKGNGFDVLEARDGNHALEVLDTRHVDLVLTDMVMPMLGGAELGKIIRARHPGLRVLYTSGYPDANELKGEDGSPLPFLAKPYGAAMLLRRVRDLLDA